MSEIIGQAIKISREGIILYQPTDGEILIILLLVVAFLFYVTAKYLLPMLKR